MNEISSHTSAGRRRRKGELSPEEIAAILQRLRRICLGVALLTGAFLVISARLGMWDRTWEALWLPLGDPRVIGEAWRLVGLGFAIYVCMGTLGYATVVIRFQLPRVLWWLINVPLWIIGISVSSWITLMMTLGFAIAGSTLTWITFVLCSISVLQAFYAVFAAPFLRKAAERYYQRLPGGLEAFAAQEEILLKYGWNIAYFGAFCALATESLGFGWFSSGHSLAAYFFFAAHQAVNGLAFGVPEALGIKLSRAIGPSGYVGQSIIAAFRVWVGVAVLLHIYFGLIKPRITRGSVRPS